MKIKNIRGFTLIELVVVVAIIGVMATSVIAVLNPFAQFQKANDAKRKTDLSQIQKALEIYYQDYGSYPDQSDYQLDPITSAPGVTHVIKTLKSWGSSWQPYMNVIPSDPTTPSKHYVYYVSNNGQTYYLYASLDRTSDPQLCKAGGASCTNVAGASCGGTCNFGLTSPDTAP